MADHARRAAAWAYTHARRYAHAALTYLDRAVNAAVVNVFHRAWGLPRITGGNSG